jgi:prepilin-type N-terminal cleavage/methylation domain-containing protein
MKIVSNKAFTLIELLVVITIIGILATWAVSVYTSQIQKWRDATRISSIEALRGSVEQYYQDISEYPLAESGSWSSTWVLQYMNSLPRDPKSWQATDKTFLEYSYAVGEDTNGLENQEYEISSWLENSWNNTAKAEKDTWNNPNRLEIWIDMITLNSWSWSDPIAKTAPAFTDCGGATSWECIIIK